MPGGCHYRDGRRARCGEVRERRVSKVMDPHTPFDAYVSMTCRPSVSRYLMRKTASIAGQLAALTSTVAAMERQLKTMSERADTQQRQADSQLARTEAQQERIDLAARELADVSERLQAAANALRESI
jgi:hypothetical protein